MFGFVAMKCQSYQTIIRGGFPDEGVEKMERQFERELSIMRAYYQYMMEHSGVVVKGVPFRDRLKEEYYRGKLEATELIARHIVLSNKPQIDYYVQFLKDKGIIKDCNNCAKNPRINKDVKDLPGCAENECYHPEYKKWVHKEVK